MEWRDDGWLYLANGGNETRAEAEAPDLPDYPFEPERLDFDTPDIDINFSHCAFP